MGILSQIDMNAGSEINPPATVWGNVALRVQSYDRDARITTGVDISTGEVLRVKLADPISADRNDVDTWSKPRFSSHRGYREMVNKLAVVAGDESVAGVIIFEAVRPSQLAGVMEARWASTAAHSAEDAKVIKAFVRPIADAHDANRAAANCGIEIARLQDAASVRSLDEMAEHIKRVVKTPFMKAVLRAQDEDKVLSFVIARPFTNEVKALLKQVNDAGAEVARAGKGFSEVAEAKVKMRTKLAEQIAAADQAAIDLAPGEFFSRNPFGKLLSTLDEVGLASLKMEIFPLQQIYPGTKYKEALTNPSSLDGIVFPRDWAREDGFGLGFGESIVAIRQHVDPNTYEPGGFQVTKIRAGSTRPLLYCGLDDLPTANINPGVAPVPAKTAIPVKEATVEPMLPTVDELTQKIAGASTVYARPRHN